MEKSPLIVIYLGLEYINRDALQLVDVSIFSHFAKNKAKIFGCKHVDATASLPFHLHFI